MSDLNAVALVGRLTRDAEVRHTAGGDAIQSLRLAVNSRTKRDGQWTDAPGFFDVTVFGREGLAQYLTKGTRVGVTGRLSWREWKAKDGTSRQAVEVLASDLQLLDGRREDGGELPVAGGNDSDIPF